VRHARGIKRREWCGPCSWEVIALANGALVSEGLLGNDVLTSNIGIVNESSRIIIAVGEVSSSTHSWRHVGGVGVANAKSMRFEVKRIVGASQIRITTVEKTSSKDRGVGVVIVNSTAGATITFVTVGARRGALGGRDRVDRFCVLAISIRVQPYGGR